MAAMRNTRPLRWCISILFLHWALTCFATDVEQQQQVSYSDSNEQGQTLYNLALKQLETIENRMSTATHRRSQSSSDQLVEWITGLRGRVDVAKSTSQHERIQIATKLLKEAADTYNNPDALFLLANINFFSTYSHPRDYNTAYEYYQILADAGNATAQHMLGFFYGTAVGNVVERDQAKSLLYHTFAAHGGETASEMTLGYRYLYGVGTEPKCEDAIYYYKRVAKKAIDHFLSGPPGGRTLPPPKLRLSDESGGIYGYGASMMTERRHRHDPGSDSPVSIEEIMQHYRYLAEKRSDIDYQLLLGRIYYEGTRAVQRDYNEARYFFGRVVEKAPPQNKMTEAFMATKDAKVIGRAAGFLGKMFWRGEGVKVDSKMAHKWFSLGAKLNDSASLNGLGMMYRDGEVVEPNHEIAMKYFTRAANQDSPDEQLNVADGQVNLAVEYIKHESSLQLGIQLFTLAAETRHLLAYWYLAQLYEEGIGLQPNCEMAVSFYKFIAERGDWSHPTVENAYNAHLQRDKESALLHYMLAAERGYEVAQSNIAYLLDRDQRLLRLPSYLGVFEAPKSNPVMDESALIYWTRSANQNNVDSRVKMGDYYYRGIGAPVDHEKAAECYRIAAEQGSSPMAMWNIGWMYEHGIGLPKDFHMAKRAYDSALHADMSAYLPVKLSLMKLYFKYYWDRLGRGDHALDDDQEEMSFWDEKPGRNAESALKERRRMEIESEKNEHRRELDLDEEMRLKYSQHMKQLEREEAENYAEPGMDGMDDYEEDEFVESLIILGICILVGWLIYVRQFRFGRNRDVANGQTNDANTGGN